MKVLAVIPHYNHAATLPAVVEAVKRHGLDILIADDGSDESCRSVLQELERNGAAVLYRPLNGGKGAAVKSGIRYAVQHGYSHILQVDADAQHCLDDISKLLAEAGRRPQALVCGWPQYGSDAPKARLYGRKITDFWNMLHTGSRQIKDGMCGFRVYPLAAVLPLLARTGDRMDFDNEILVRLYWQGVPLIWHDTPVRYDAGGISHFQAARDNWLISKMHARLFFEMLARRITGKLP